MMERCNDCEYKSGADCMFWDASLIRISNELGCTKYDSCTEVNNDNR